MRNNRRVEAGTLRSTLLLGAVLAMVAGQVQAQKSPPPPPPPPKKGKVYPKAKDYGQPARILKLNPDQKKIDPKLLKTAPTVDQAMRQKLKGKSVAKAAGTPGKPKPAGAPAGKTTRPAVKPPAKPAPKATGAKKTPPRKTAPKKS